MNQHNAYTFIETDPAACVDDAIRLGIDEAAQYLLFIAHSDPDKRWGDVTWHQMRDALTDEVEEAAIAGYLPWDFEVSK